MFEENKENSNNNFLIVIIELCRNNFSNSSNTDSLFSGTKCSSPFESVLEQLFIFLKSFCLLQRNNQVAIIGCDTIQSRFLYSTFNPNQSIQTDTQESFVTLSSNEANSVADSIDEQAIIDAIKYWMMSSSNTCSNIGDEVGKSPVLFAGAISQALCYLNRVTNKTSYKKSSLSHRIFVLCTSPSTNDANLSLLYAPIMNCIFAAQKQSVLIDVFYLSDQDSLFLKQVSFLTNGIYYRSSRVRGILQHLITLFLPDSNLRQSILKTNIEHTKEITDKSSTHTFQTPTASVDLRVACFCHHKFVNVGWVCPACLSVFCECNIRCLTCNTRLPLEAQPILPIRN